MKREVNRIKSRPVFGKTGYWFRLNLGGFTPTSKNRFNQKKNTFLIKAYNLRK